MMSKDLNYQGASSDFLVQHDSMVHILPGKLAATARRVPYLCTSKLLQNPLSFARVPVT